MWIGLVRLNLVTLNDKAFNSFSFVLLEFVEERNPEEVKPIKKIRTVLGFCPRATGRVA